MEEAHIRDLTSVVRVGDASGVRSETTYRYDETDVVPAPGLVGWANPGRTRGNATRTARWLDRPGPGETAEAVATRTFDQAGNVVSVRHELGRETRIAYEDRLRPVDLSLPAGPDEAGEKVGAIGVDFEAEYVREVQDGIRNRVGIAFILTYAGLFLMVRCP